MKRFAMVGITATLLCCAGSPALGATCLKPGKGTVSQFSDGGEYARSTAVATVGDAREAHDFDMARCGAQTLLSYYDARAGRQQTILNMEANMVLLTASVAGLSRGAGATTQGYWTGAALSPGVFAQFYANEPTRDLFHTGFAMLTYVSNRYYGIHQNLAALAPDFPDTGATPLTAPAFKTACDQLAQTAAHVAGWAEADRLTVMPEVDRLQSECDTATASNYALQSFARVALRAKSNSNDAYADVVMGLDGLLRKQDRELRMTPSGAISQFLASPFLLIGSVLSQNDAKSAVAAVASQKAIDTLKVAVPGIDNLPPAPATRALPAAVSAQARARQWAAHGAGAPTPTDIQTALAELTATRDALANDEPEYNRKAQIIQQLAAAGRAQILSAKFDASTRTVEVQLQDPPNPATVAPKPVPTTPAAS